MYIDPLAASLSLRAPQNMTRPPVRPFADDRLLHLNAADVLRCVLKVCEDWSKDRKLLNMVGS